MAEPIDLGIEGLSECKEIGGGGFSRVYAAWEDRFGRRVAVKVLQHLDHSLRNNFELEQLTMGRMTGHPNVVIPHASGYTADGYPYLLMEYMERGSLADLVADEGPMGWGRAVDAILPIADALGFGHSQGVLHRDVKPANILVGPTGTTKLADFGISFIREATMNQLSAFSLAHSPPETFAGGTDGRDERSDLYSLASTLFTIVRGVPPFHAGDGADNQFAYIDRIINLDVPGEGLEPAQHDFLRRAMAKEPDRRPSTASHFISELEATVAQATDPPPPTLPRCSPGPTGGTSHEGRIMMRTWPASTDYTAAVQTPDASFTAPLLQTFRAVPSPLGVPTAATGQNAIVFLMVDTDGRHHALRCFTSAPDDSRDRYLALQHHLLQVGQPTDLAPTSWIDNGVLVGGQPWPVVLMPWIEGRRLDVAVEDLLDDDPSRLRVLAAAIHGSVERLQSLGIAHGDLQHGNIIVGDDLSVTLVDFDGVWVSSAAYPPPMERGHPNYQHPGRDERCWDRWSTRSRPC